MILNTRKKTARKPAHVQITPQRQDFAFADVPRYWFDNDPVLSHFLNALSLTFPDGERLFVDSVREFRDVVTDKARQKEISGFIGQEAMHSLEHVSMNNMLEAKGLPAREVLRTYVDGLRKAGAQPARDWTRP
mgnify:CR=1 FL=1